MSGYVVVAGVVTRHCDRGAALTTQGGGGRWAGLGAWNGEKREKEFGEGLAAKRGVCAGLAEFVGDEERRKEEFVEELATALAWGRRYDMSIFYWLQNLTDK